MTSFLYAAQRHKPPVRLAERNMQRITRLLFWLMVIGALHMTEQLFFGVEELELFKPVLADYYLATAAIGPDRATVILVTVVVTFFTWLCYAILSGGPARFIALGFFGLLGANEAHHVIQAIAKGGYDSGLVTCIPYSWVGILMLIALWREYRGIPASSAGYADSLPGADPGDRRPAVAP
jgi:hypothetical protein